MRKKVRHLVLVRHGESQWNAKGLWTGWQDVSLTEKGKEQARQAATSLRDIPFHIAFTSDLSRSIETLNIIKRELGLDTLTTIKEPGFKERHYGKYTGKDKWQVKKEVGDEKFKRIRRGWDEAIPGGESLKDVYLRVVPHINKHIYPRIKKGENLLLSIHSNSIRAIVKHDRRHLGQRYIRYRTSNRRDTSLQDG